MDNGKTGSRKGKVVVREDDEAYSYSCDSESTTDQESNQPKEAEASYSILEPTRSGVRVSLACVPCRSRHVKCGAETPHCRRCLQDNKTCFYAKSRRGLRDKNAPHKRVSMREAGNPSSISGIAYRGAPVLPQGHPYGGSASYGSVNSNSCSPRLGALSVGSSNMIDSYYLHFHRSHPFVLPQYYLQTRLRTDPDSLKNLASMMQWIGSLFIEDVSSQKLRDTALNQVDFMGLPPNGFTVQTILLAAITVHSEDEKAYARALLDRAVCVALDIRMNSREFANMERDPILGESWRRTWWELYIMDSCFACLSRGPVFFLYTIESDVELPCEEADYDGIIPRSKTLSEYDSRDFEEETPIFSSFTYLIDLCRIAGVVLSVYRTPGKSLESLVANADAMLVGWKLHLPREKHIIVDRNNEVDELLFQAHNLLQILLISIHRPLSRLQPTAFEPPQAIPFPPPSNNPTEDHASYLHTRKSLEAAESCIGLYTLPIPILLHTPLSICSLSIATLTCLSACAFVLNGEEWIRIRERVRIGLGAMKSFGAVWELGRKGDSETKLIARNVFLGKEEGHGGVKIGIGRACISAITAASESSGGLGSWDGSLFDYSLLGVSASEGWDGIMYGSGGVQRHGDLHYGAI